MSEYDGPQVVGVDLHRRRSVIVRQSGSGERLGVRRIVNDPAELMAEIGQAGRSPRVVLEATYGWYWAADALAEAGAEVHLAHPLGVKGFSYRRVKNDVRDASDLADLLRMGRLPEAWIAPPGVRELRELVRHRIKLVQLRSALKASVHAVLAKQGVLLPVSDVFGVRGRRLLADAVLDAPYRARVNSLCRLIEACTWEIDLAAKLITQRLADDRGYQVIQQLPGIVARSAGGCCCTPTVSRKAHESGNNGSRPPARRSANMRSSSGQPGTPDERVADRLIHAHCQRQVTATATGTALLPAHEPSELA